MTRSRPDLGIRKLWMLILAGVSLASAVVNDGTYPVLQYSNPSLKIGHVSTSAPTPVNTLIFKTANAERAWLDSEGRLGIGAYNQGAYHPNANQLVISKPGSGAGITIASPSNQYGSLYFADGANGSE